MSRPCAPPTEYGKQSIAALKRCCKPPNLTDWPAELTESGNARPAANLVPVKGPMGKGIVLSFVRNRLAQAPAPKPAGETQGGLLHTSGLPTKIDHTPSLPVYIQNLIELLELKEAGEPVVLPDGLTTFSAAQLIVEAKQELGTQVDGSNSRSKFLKTETLTEEDASLPPVNTKEAKL